MSDTVLNDDEAVKDDDKESQYLSTGPEWTFELIETYDRELAL